MKGLGAKISKGISTNFVLSFDDVLSDINNLLAEKSGENDKIGDNLDELCAGEEIYSNPSEGFLEEKQETEELEDNVN